MIDECAANEAEAALAVATAELDAAERLEAEAGHAVDDADDELLSIDLASAGRVCGRGGDGADDDWQSPTDRRRKSAPTPGSPLLHSYEGYEHEQGRGRFLSLHGSAGEAVNR